MTIVQALRLNRAFTSLLLGALVTLGAAPATAGVSAPSGRAVMVTGKFVF